MSFDDAMDSFGNEYVCVKRNKSKNRVHNQKFGFGEMKTDPRFSLNAAMSHWVGGF